MKSRIIEIRCDQLAELETENILNLAELETGDKLKFYLTIYLFCV